MGIWSYLFGKGRKEAPLGDDALQPMSFLAIRDAPSTSALPRHVTVLHVEGSGEYDFDVVGEASYQDALAAITGGKKPDGHEYECVAVLTPEPSNPYDSNAVRVSIDGRTVGYIPRELAKRISGMIGRAPNVTALSVDAMVVGGWHRHHGSQGNFGVKLDMP